MMIEYICKTCQLHVGVFAFAQQQQINLLRICVLQSDIVAPNVCNSYRLLWVYNFFIAFLWTIQTEQSIVNQLYAGLSSRDHACRLHLWFSFSTDSGWSSHTSYLSFFLHEQNFWRIRFTPKKRVNYDKIHSKLPFFCVITAKYTVNCQFFALNL